MVLLDAVGKRWTLRILWELRGEPLTFRALRAAADDVSPSVLNGRLSELRELGIVELGDDGYTMTEAGRELGDVLMALNGWADAHL
ncbi:MAG: helix-turn-helix transcriptional regulator [Deltaproteobacteria bacterium]|nr:helix-turn-helix transcriptional regulator [Deltaproteobacteria bacterium]